VDHLRRLKSGPPFLDLEVDAGPGEAGPGLGL
jgi:hypothetical protein